MDIGIARVEEAKVKDSRAGYHQFLTPEDETYGSFEVFWCDEGTTFKNPEGETYGGAGWYWWACHPGCIPDGDPIGPFASSIEAYYHAAYED